MSGHSMFQEKVLGSPVNLCLRYGFRGVKSGD